MAEEYVETQYEVLVFRGVGIKRQPIHNWRFMRLIGAGWFAEFSGWVKTKITRDSEGCLVYV